jgi:hypothetical protein
MSHPYQLRTQYSGWIGDDPKAARLLHGVGVQSAFYGKMCSVTDSLHALAYEWFSRELTWSGYAEGLCLRI